MTSRRPDDNPADSDLPGEIPLVEKPLTPLKGRGAVVNLQGRFEIDERRVFDDGWSQDEEESGPSLRTQVFDEYAKSILTRNQSPDIGSPAPFGCPLPSYSRMARR